MPRIVRNLICGQYLHIMSQGINREYILKYDNDKEKYLKLMERYSMKFEVNVIAYCIMSNHVHILVKSTNINNISNFMRMINGNYAMYYNKKYDRVGFVFRSRFKSKVIMSEKSLIRCIKYIHMNPVKAKIVENEEEYKYSSYINFKNNFGIYSLEKLNSMLKVDKEFSNRDFQINDKEEQTYTYEIFNLYMENKNLTIEQMKGDNKIQKQFLEEIKNKRIDNEINKSELARILGIARCTIYKYLKENTISNLAPTVCGICGKINSDGLCPKCTKILEKCAKFEIINKNICMNFENLIYIFKYEGIIRKLILDYKFNEKPYIYVSFVNFILKNKKIFEILKSYDTIIPVPISRKRMKERGYNQSLLIAKKLSEDLNIQLQTNCLFKTKNIVEQSKLNKEQREKNIQNVYELKNEQIINNKKILLIDDIYTTGSTVNECSKMLRKAQPRKVDVLVLAKD